MEKSENTVWFDMDGVMYDFDGAAIENIAPEDRRMCRDFYLAESYGDRSDLQQAIKDTYNHPDFFYNLETLPGVPELFDELLCAGYEPRVLSAPLSSNQFSLEGKRYSLQRDFGRNVLRRAIFTKEKYNFPGLILNDDRPQLAHGDNATDFHSWAHVYVYGRYDQDHIPATTARFSISDFTDRDEYFDLLDRIRYERYQ